MTNWLPDEPIPAAFVVISLVCAVVGAPLTLLFGADMARSIVSILGSVSFFGFLGAYWLTKKLDG